MATTPDEEQWELHEKYAAPGMATLTHVLGGGASMLFASNPTVAATAAGVMSLGAAVAAWHYRNDFIQHGKYSNIPLETRQSWTNTAYTAIGIEWVIGLLWVFFPSLFAVWAAASIGMVVAVAVGVSYSSYRRTNHTLPKPPKKNADADQDDKAGAMELRPEAGLPAVRDEQQILNDATNAAQLATARQAGMPIGGPQQDIMTANFMKVMHRSQLGFCRPAGPPEDVFDSDEKKIGTRFRVRVPAAQQKAGGGDAITAAHAEIIASSFSELAEENGQFLPISASWIAIKRLTVPAGVYEITVLDEDVLDRLYAYKNDPTPTSIRTPALLGYTQEGKQYTRRLDKHSALVGQTEGGKSSQANVDLGHTTLCEDEVDWALGVEKLVDFTYPWLRPYIGSEFLPPFDLVAVGPMDCALTLSMAMYLARKRQAAPYEVRAQFKDVLVWMDEATYTLQHENALAIYSGQLKNSSATLEDGMKGAASARIRFKIVAQQGTHRNWGTNGSGINANIQDQSIFQTNDTGELGRAFKDWTIPGPSRPGEALYGVSGSTPTRLKIPYIQPNDPGKKMLLPDGPFMDDVAWSRRFIANGLDEWSANVLGAWYANRRRRAEDMDEYVRRGESDVTDPRKPFIRSTPWPMPSANAKVIDLANTTQTAGTSTVTEAVPEPVTPEATADAVPTLSMSFKEREHRETTYDRINSILAKHGKAPLSDPENPDYTPKDTNEEEDAITTPMIDDPFFNPGTTEEAEPEPVASASGLLNEPMFAMAPVPERVTRSGNILKIIEAADEPLTRKEIITALIEEYGDEAAPQSLPQLATNALKTLIDRGEIQRTNDNRYARIQKEGNQP